MNRNLTTYFSFIALTMIIMSAKLMAANPTPDSSTTPAPKPISITGLVDAYFSYNFANPASRTNSFSRNFDVNANQFSIGLAKVTFQKSAEPVGFRIDLAYGQTMDIVHTMASPTGSDETYKNIEQAYLTTVIPLGKGLTVNAGKMVTHMGAEVIESNANLNYSRSLLFQYAIPYYHTGICASYPFADNLTVTGYLYNGWNSVIDNNKQKTVGASLSWFPTSALQIIGNVISGNEQSAGTAVHPKNVYEAIVNYTASDKLLFALDANYGEERQIGDVLALWKGVALYGKYTISDAAAVIARVEDFNDCNGYATTIIQDLKEITLTYEYRTTSNLLLRLEYRRDYSTEAAFLDKDSKPVGNQNTLTLGAVVTF